MENMSNGSSVSLKQKKMPGLKIARNDRFLVDENSNPFFWLGDTAWLLFKKLTREDAETYLKDRVSKGFNVIQAVLLHNLNDTVNIYGNPALTNRDITRPLNDNQTGGYWNHVDALIDLAADKGLYMALIPVWGSNIKHHGITVEQVCRYGKWLAERYKNKSNIIWINGGDINPSDHMDVWNTLGKTLKGNDPNHLITFHPFGRSQSSMWFHHEPWLDFNMFQSGHRRYDQDDTELNYGEDNWKYVQADYSLHPVKPTLDGEPSYEGIPQGLHDPTQPYWNDRDVRRYAYWSVLAGAFGFTYGHNAVMQFYKPEDKTPAYGAKIYWDQALKAPGAAQMNHLKELMLSRSFFERVPDPSIVAGENGEKYDYLAAARGEDYAFIYSFQRRRLPIQLGMIRGDRITASWYSPRNGTFRKVGEFENAGVREFRTPDSNSSVEDWVLILDSK